MSLLRVEALTVALHGRPVLKGVDLAMAPGETLGVIGESGSGKTLTALAVMGLLPHGARAEGRVAVAGEDWLRLSEAELCARRGRDVGMVFQEPMTALNPVRAIGDQVAETVRVHERAGRAEAMDRARDALARAGLPASQIDPGRYPHELSGGQRQRVGVAIAIVLRPKLLIADEPTTALDVTTQAQVLALLKGLARGLDMGLMLITHDLAVVAGMADRIAVMRQGEVVETAATPTLLRARRHPYTQALFAASSHQVALPPPPPPHPLLSVTDVVREYRRPPATLLGPTRRFRAVDRVSFTLHRGERLGLVGESGCGKSTLSRAVLGLEPIQDGTITLDGAPVFRDGAPNPVVRGRMQAVFQDPYSSFNPRHRVARLVAEPFHAQQNPPSRSAQRDAVHAALEAVGLAARDAEKTIHAFSGGQRQRIAIARALVVEPEFIVFDEAVSALDVSVRAQVLDLLADLCRRRALSYIFISHDLSVVRSVTDRVLVMRAGAIVEEGPTAAVFDSPRHAYTQALLAAAPKLPETGDAHAAAAGGAPSPADRGP